jgi:hypothetical protein
MRVDQHIALFDSGFDAKARGKIVERLMPELILPSRRTQPKTDLHDGVGGAEDRMHLDDRSAVRAKAAEVYPAVEYVPPDRGEAKESSSA